MFSYQELLVIVKDEQDFHAGKARQRGDGASRARHRRLRDALAQIHQIIEGLALQQPTSGVAEGCQPVVRNTSSADTAPAPSTMGYQRNIVDLDDISDLPDDLVAAMGLTKGDQLERKLVCIAADAKQALTVNQFLAAYYRRFNEKLDRQMLAGKLYRMTDKKKNLLVTPVGKRGVYGLPEMVAGL